LIAGLKLLLSTSEALVYVLVVLVVGACVD